MDYVNDTLGCILPNRILIMTGRLQNTPACAFWDCGRPQILTWIRLSAKFFSSRRRVKQIEVACCLLSAECGPLKAARHLHKSLTSCRNTLALGMDSVHHLRGGCLSGTSYGSFNGVQRTVEALALTDLARQSAVRVTGLDHSEGDGES